MEKADKILKNKKVILTIGCILILTGLGIYLYLSNSNNQTTDNISILEEVEKDIQEENIQLNENNVENNEKVQQEIKEKIAIHITGEVKKTGIIYLEEGARIADAINAAGGATKNASLEQVNLAYILEDGQKIYIPNKKEKIETNAYIITNSGNNVLIEKGKGSSNTNVNAKANQNMKGANIKVNINSANQTELETLPGIGPSLAGRIIEYRESNGKFQQIEDIQNVKGIGDSKYSNIKEYICI